MPTYTYRCPTHGDRDIFLPFAEHGPQRWCGECLREGRDTKVVQVIGLPRIAKSSLQHEARWDYELGGVVSSQQDREELLKKRSEEAGKNLVWTDPGDMKSSNEEGIAEKEATLRPSTTRHL